MKKKRSVILGILAAVSLLLAAGCDTAGSKGGATTTTNKPTVYSIGDTGPSGVGIVFYITDGGLHGMEVAPLPTEWASKEWGKFGTPVTGTGTAIGTGKNNTASIVAVLNAPTAVSDTAAQLCDGLSYNGYDDWYLPSKDELKAIWDNLVNDGTGSNNGVGGFNSTGLCYWSSSEYDFTGQGAWGQSFTAGDQTHSGKGALGRVRAVRDF
jgi:hypothetical protein